MTSALSACVSARFPSVNLDRHDLERLLRASDGAAFLHRLGRECSSHSGRPHAKEWARVGVFVRRYSASTRPSMPFHCDGNACTCNVALSGPADHQGGALLCLVGGGVRSIPREIGAATIHSGELCHAVTPVSGGTRYALLAFFYDEEEGPAAEPARLGTLPGGGGGGGGGGTVAQRRHPGIQEL